MVNDHPCLLVPAFILLKNAQVVVRDTSGSTDRRVFICAILQAGIFHVVFPTAI